MLQVKTIRIFGANSRRTGKVVSNLEAVIDETVNKFIAKVSKGKKNETSVKEVKVQVIKAPSHLDGGAASAVIVFDGPALKFKEDPTPEADAPAAGNGEGETESDAGEGAGE